MMMDLPPRDQASSKGPVLIPIVANNTERGGESVLSSQIFLFQIQMIYATSVKNAYMHNYVEGNPRIQCKLIIYFIF